MTHRSFWNRRQFLGAGGMALAASASAAPQSSRANSKTQVGMIGVGGRGSSLMRLVLGMEEGGAGVHVQAVCDVYEKRKQLAQERSKAEFATLDYREVLGRKDVDAVIVATPDHWHATIAIEAMRAGKDVYLEKPMTHTIEEAKKVVQVVKETRRVLQVGSQTTSKDQWWKARKAIQDGMIGKLISSQGSYHRNSIAGEWNSTPERGNRSWQIEAQAGPNAKGVDYIDWDMWLGPAEKREFDPQRYFRFRKFWDYSGGVATDLFYHVVAPLQICWGEPQFPHRVVSSGGIWAFPDREVPDTFNLLADFPKKHSLVLSASMANSTHIPGLIRGQKGTITMVDHGQFEGATDHITVAAERIYEAEFEEKFGGYKAVDIPVAETPEDAHMANFLECVRTRQKPHLDADTGYHAQVIITMGVQSFRESKVLFWDPKAEKVVYEPPSA
ncbi:MAG: gfo/Idh/MocA family oxidoreductase [Acidobacteria bacterium]|nr:gfo/Idh/MocA family oxidoreductase [Acidobacteriota bacterium]